VADDAPVSAVRDAVPLWDVLANAARRGQADAFDRGFDKLRPTLERIVERHMSQKLKAVLEANDVVQQVSIVVFRSILTVSFAREAAFRAWLERIVQTQLIDLTRRHFETQRHGSAPRSLDETVGKTDGGDHVRRGDAVAAATAGPATKAFRRELAEKVKLVLAELPEHYAEVLRLRVLEGRTTEDVSIALGKTPGAIRQLQQRALVECRNVLLRKEWLRPGATGSRPGL
jgi:RNA polymerase sigma-70 factor (ECF subfamily)